MKSKGKAQPKPQSKASARGPTPIGTSGSLPAGFVVAASGPSPSREFSQITSASLEPWSDPPPLTDAPSRPSTTTVPSGSQKQQQQIQVFEDESNSTIDLGSSGKTPIWKRPVAVPVLGEVQALVVVKIGAAPTAPYSRENVAAQVLRRDVPGATAFQLLASALLAVIDRSPAGIPKPWELIYPKTAGGAPRYNAAGRYEVRLSWLGSWKKVVVDDRLPYDSSSGSMLLLQATSPNELWPAIITKAVLKLMSGRSQQLMHNEMFFVSALTGFVPEQFTSPVPWSALCRLASKDSAQIPVAVAKQPQTPPTTSASVQVRSSVPSDRVCPIVSAEAVAGVRSVKLLAWQKPVPPVEQGDASPVSREVVLPEAEFWAQYNLHSYLQTSHLGNSKSLEMDPQKASVPHALFFNNDAPSQLIACAFLTPSNAMLAKYQSKPVAPHEVSGSWALEAIEWDSPLSSSKVQLTVRGMTMAAGVLTVPPGPRVLAIRSDCLWTSRLQLMSESDFSVGEQQQIISEKLGIVTTTLDGTFKAQEPGTWAVWFRYAMTVKASMTVTARLQVADETAKQFAKIRLINNDTSEESEAFANSILPARLVPNAAGYTLYGDCKCPSAKPQSGLFQVIVSCSSPEFTIEPEPNKHIHEHEEVSAPDRSAVLFKHTLRPAAATSGSIHLSVAHLVASGQCSWIPRIRLQLLDRGEVVIERQGLSSVTIPVAKFHRTAKEEDHKYAIQATLEEGPTVPAIHTPATVDQPEPSSGQGPATAKRQHPRAASRTRPGSTMSVTPQAKPGEELLQQQAPQSQPTPAAAQPVTLVAQPVPQVQAQAQAQAHQQFAWRLRIYSGMPIEGRKDTEKEEKLAEIKAKWDQGAGAGRSQRAAAARERWLEQQLRGATTKPLREIGMASAEVTSNEELAKSTAELQESLVAHNGRIEEMVAAKEREKETTLRLRDEFDRDFRKRQADVAAWAASQLEWRTAFNKARQEAAAAAAAIARQQELEAKKREQELAEQLQLQQQQQQQQQQAQAASQAEATQEQQKAVEAPKAPVGRGRRSRPAK